MTTDKGLQAGRACAHGQDLASDMPPPDGPLVEGATDWTSTGPEQATPPPPDRLPDAVEASIPETATLANVLANQGVVSGLTGEPLTEAAILGIGGGLGAGLHPLGVPRVSALPVLTPRIPESVAVPLDPRLDRQDARPARHRARSARDRRRDPGS
jgi:hypothetical protein